MIGCLGSHCCMPVMVAPTVESHLPQIPAAGVLAVLQLIVNVGYPLYMNSRQP